MEPTLTGIRPDDTSRDWLDNLVAKAIEGRASDVHIEPRRGESHIRFRIDGIMYPLETFNRQFHETIVSKIKVHSQIDITQHRLPQDGHFEFSHGQRIYNMRVSTFPTIYGETVVFRVLNRDEALLNLSELGLDEAQLALVDNLIHRPYGMVLITGPSGSGKTTFLNSVLNNVNSPENNVVTIEDPVELQMKGIRQTQVNQYEAFNFAAALRAVLRQDPDVVMVGEIRDNETAQISVQAALTGRLVFSTFHTLDVFGIITRFIEMGVPRSVLAHTISGVVQSRLVRKICENCKVPHEMSEEERKIVGDHLANSALYKGKGCERCLRSGYWGRTGVFEVVLFDGDIRAMIVESPTLVDMFNLLRRKKIKSLGESAMEKVNEGVTTLEEVLRVVGDPFSPMQ